MIMFTADTHCDTLSAIAVWGVPFEKCAVTPERLRQGNVGLQTFAMFAGSKGPAGTPYADAKKMMAAAHNLGLPIYDRALPAEPPTFPAGVLSIEGGEILEGRLDRLAEFDDEIHLRLIALTWNHENEIAHPAARGPEGGLKPFGRELLAEMDRRGILADVSHLNEAGFWDLCEHAALPIVASHSNCRWLCDVPRNLKREQMQAIIERRGFIGINFYSAFLVREGEAVLDDVLRHIDAICEMGGEDVLGFGSDFDGIERWPEGLANPADFPALIELLRAHGYTEAQLEKIAGLNYWNLLKRVERAVQAV